MIYKLKLQSISLKLSECFQEVETRNEKIKVLIQKLRALIQDLDLIVQLETSQ